MLRPKEQAMFTMQDFKSIQQYLRNDSVFSPERDELCYELSLLNSTKVGLSGELMLAKRLRMCGFTVHHYVGKNDFDILLNDSIRVEVKLATYNNTKKGYVIQKIKPELCDIIFFCFLTPDGTVVKWTRSKHIVSWANENKMKRGPDGYNPFFDRYCDNINMAYSDSFDSFVDEYSPGLTKRKNMVEC
jgi:hypothetical protein